MEIPILIPEKDMSKTFKIELGSNEFSFHNFLVADCTGRAVALNGYPLYSIETEHENTDISIENK